ncbi:MAG: PAS domain S-box protein [Candidatus Nanopelagicales bacterium]
MTGPADRETSARITREDFENTLGGLPQGVVVRGPDVAVRYANPAAREILGISADHEIDPAEVASWRIVDESGAPVDMPVQRVAAEGLSWHGLLFRIERPGHPALWLQSDAQPFAFSDGTVGSLSVFTDVTPAQEARLEAEQNAQTLRLLTASATDVLWRTDAAGHMQWASESLTRVLGWDPEALRGTDLLDIVHPDDRDQAAQARLTALSGGQTRAEVRIRRADDWWCPVGLRVGPFRDSAGVVTGTVTVARDMSAETGVAEQLAESQRLMRILTDLADRLSLASGITEVCRVAAELVSQTLADGCLVSLITGDGTEIRPAASFHRDPAPRDALLRVLAGAPSALAGTVTGEVLATRQPVILNVDPPDAADTEFRARFARTARENSMGNVVVAPLIALGEPVGSLSLFAADPFPRESATAIAAVAQRVALAVRTATLNEQVRAAERRFRMIAENTADVVMLIRTDGHIEWVSPSARRTLGWEPTDLVGRSNTDLVHPDDLPRFRREAASLVSSGGAGGITARVRRGDGSYIWAEAASQPVPAEGDQPAYRVVRMRDVSEQIRAFEALAASEQRFRATLDAAPVGMAVVDLDRRFVDVNDALSRLLDRSPEWLSTHGIADVILPADDGDDAEMRAELFAGTASRISRDHRFVRADGEEIAVHHVVGLLRDDKGTPTAFISQFLEAAGPPGAE